MFVKGLNFLVFGAVKEALRRVRVVAGMLMLNVVCVSDVLILGVVVGLLLFVLLYLFDLLLV